MQEKQRRKTQLDIPNKNRSKSRLQSTTTNDISNYGGLSHITACGNGDWTDKKTVEDFYFADYLCLMPNKLKDLQLKTNKLAEETDRKDVILSEHREPMHQ